MQDNHRTDVMAELAAAQANNIGCILHAEDHPVMRRESVWTFDAPERSRRMRERCARTRVELRA